MMSAPRPENFFLQQIFLSFVAVVELLASILTGHILNRMNKVSHCEYFRECFTVHFVMWRSFVQSSRKSFKPFFVHGRTALAISIYIKGESDESYEAHLRQPTTSHLSENLGELPACW